VKNEEGIVVEYQIPTLSDEDVDSLIEWLGTKETVGEKVITLVIQTLEGLKQDRFNLVQRLEKFREIEEFREKMNV
jgi:hypothetical protein